jgi:cytochrome c553
MDWRSEKPISPRMLNADEGCVHKTPHPFGLRLASIIGVSLLAALLACVQPLDAAEAPSGAASCSGCHPAKASVNTPVPRLDAHNPAEIVAAMEGFKSGQRPSTVMGRIAKGFSESEINAIAAWYGGQKQ